MTPSRKRFDRKKKGNLKRFLAVRDGLVPPGAFEDRPDPYVRCAECDGLIHFDGATIGHVLALSRGGTNERKNLRLECDSCNQEANYQDQFRTSLERMNPEDVTLRQKNRVAEFCRSREQARNSHVYDSIRVLAADGSHAAYTSPLQLGLMVPTGKLRIVEWDSKGLPSAVQLAGEYPLLSPDPVLRENRCGVCDGLKYLGPFSFWPRWHPEWRGARKTHRTIPLCRHCRVDTQGWIEREVEALVPMGKQPFMGRELRAKVSLLLTAHGRLKRRLELSPDLVSGLCEEFGVDVEAMVVARGLEATLLEFSLRVRSYLVGAEEGRYAWHVEKRKRIMAANVDYHEIFWRFLWQRRAEYEGFLRTDGAKERHIEKHLRKVRIEREERALQARRAGVDSLEASVPAPGEGDGTEPFRQGRELSG